MKQKTNLEIDNAIFSGYNRFGGGKFLKDGNKKVHLGNLGKNTFRMTKT